MEGKIKGGIEVTGRRGRRHRKLLDDLKKGGYIHLEKEALDRTMWRAGFGRSFGRSFGRGFGRSFRRGFGPVVRQTAN
jgi:hypothetical protein